MDDLLVREMFDLYADDDGGAEVRAWATPFGADLRAAFRACPRADWALRLAVAGGIDDATFRRAALAVALLALEAVPAARAILSPRMPAQMNNAEVKELHQTMNALARTDPKTSLALRAVLRASSSTTEWPSAADLSRGALADPAALDAACVAAVHAHIAPQKLAARVPRPAAYVPIPLYVEVTASAPAWAAIRAAWNLAAQHKPTAIDPDAEMWTKHAQGDALATLRHALYALDSCEIEMLPAGPLDAGRGRLPFVPFAFPYGGIWGMRTFVQAFGGTVVAYDEGTGRSED